MRSDCIEPQKSKILYSDFDKVREQLVGENVGYLTFKYNEIYLIL